MPRTRNAPLPFGADLNGTSRVDRRTARTCWAHGIPVWQDAGRGAVRLRPPAHALPDDKKPGFDSACLAAEPWIRDRYSSYTDALRKKCVYLIPYGPMALHFTFEDKSNPFVKYGTAAELMPEIRAWSLRWTLSPDPCGAATVAHFVLKEKTTAPGGLFSPMP